MISDYHVHTYFSSDCEVSPREHISKAIACGMSEICFTDHMDYDYPLENGKEMFRLDVDAYFNELRALKEEFSDKIHIKIGIELGLNPSIEPDNRALVHKYPFDFVIGSSHMVDGMDPYYPKFWEGRNIDEVINAYYESILKNLTNLNNFNFFVNINYI